MNLAARDMASLAESRQTHTSGDAPREIEKTAEPPVGHAAPEPADLPEGRSRPHAGSAWSMSPDERYVSEWDPRLA
jgi:hypothetical protein